jgi:hypothetical protein
MPDVDREQRDLRLGAEPVGVDDAGAGELAVDEALGFGVGQLAAEAALLAGDGAVEDAPRRADVPGLLVVLGIHADALQAAVDDAVDRRVVEAAAVVLAAGRFFALQLRAILGDGLELRVPGVLARKLLSLASRSTSGLVTAKLYIASSCAGSRFSLA